MEEKCFFKALKNFSLNAQCVHYLHFSQFIPLTTFKKDYCLWIALQFSHHFDKQNLIPFNPHNLPGRYTEISPLYK